MSVLSDLSIRAMLEREDAPLVIDPFDPDCLQPASYDVRLGTTLIQREPGTIVDPEADQSTLYSEVPLAFGRWLLFPGQLYLGATAEYLEIPDDLVGLLHGRSTLARAGITVHQQAGLLDPGYRGCPTLEITVVYPTWLRPGAAIGQLTFHRLTSRALLPYGHPRLGSRYQNDRVPTPGRVREEVTP